MADVKLPELPDSHAHTAWGSDAYLAKQLHAYATAAVELNRVVVDDAMVERALGQTLAEITNPEVWPENYADGFNDAVRTMRECMRAALIAALAKE